MPEVTKQIKVIGVDYVCDKCGEGLMLQTGLMLASSPPQYPHICNKCKHEHTFRGIKYPTTRYEEINNETS